jgi:hypothetical protein
MIGRGSTTVVLLLAFPLHSAAAQALTIGPEIASIELSPGVEEVMVDERGNVIARAYLSGATAYDATGRKLGPMPGSGAIWGVGAAGEGRAVLARSEGSGDSPRIETVAFRDGELETASVASLAFNGIDVCAIGDRVYVLEILRRGAAPAPLIREIDASGSTVRRFGRRERPPEDLEAVMGSSGDYLLSMGDLACDERSETVYFSAIQFGVVRAFTADGVEKWRVVLPDFIRTKIGGLGPDRCCSYAEPVDPVRGSFQHLKSITFDGEGRLLVGLLENRFTRGRRTGMAFQLRVLDPETGAELARQDTDGIVVAVVDGKAYLHRPTLEPRGPHSLKIHSLIVP